MKKIIKYLFVFLGSLITLYILYAYVYANFHQIDDKVYRSAQLNSLNYSYYLQNYNIKTVLNLRGAEPTKNWYKQETKEAEKNNIKLIDFKMFSGAFYNYQETKKLVEIMQEAEKPLLIHCINGADRTSLASALYTYAIKNKSAKEAKKQLAWYYGHLPSIRPHVIRMDKSFDNFVQKHKKHSKQN
jgi:protein tyrosine/serine phosphatase